MLMHVPVSAWAFMSRLQDGQDRNSFLIIIPHNNVSINDRPHIIRWSHKIIVLQYILTILTTVLQTAYSIQ